MRCGGSRTGFVTLIALLSSIIGLLATAPARADDVIHRAGQAFSEARLYVDPGAEGLLSDEQKQAIARRLDVARSPMYLAVLSDDALDAVDDDPARLVAEIERAADDRPGTYIVMVDEVFVAGSTIFGRRATAIADWIAAIESNPVERVRTFVDQVELAAARADAPQQPPDRSGAGGLPGSWLVIGLLILAFAWLPLAWRRGRQHAVDDLSQVRRAVGEDATSLAKEIAALDGGLRAAAVNPPARTAFAHAIEACERARQAAARIAQAADVRRVTSILEEGWYELAAVRAHLAGQPAPERRPPCLFDPRHGPAATYVDWTPPKADSRPVPVCLMDAISMSEGRAPQIRMVEYNGERCAYWDAAQAFAEWAEGWHSAEGPLALLTYLWGTPIGEAWDDPAVATTESPFDGWREPA